MASDSLGGSIEAYVRQSSAFFHELATTPLMSSAKTTAKPYMYHGGGGVGSPVLSHITIANLASTVESLACRVGRLEAIVHALDGSRRSNDLLHRHGAADEAAVQAALSPVSQAIQYHERALMDVAVTLEELRRTQLNHAKKMNEFFSQPPTVGFQASRTNEQHHGKQSETSASIQRMSALAAQLAEERKASEDLLRQTQLPPQTVAATPTRQPFTSDESTMRRATVSPTTTSASPREESMTGGGDTDQQQPPGRVRPIHHQDDDVARHREPVPTDVSTEGATTVTMDELSGVGEHTATTVLPQDMSRTYAADVSGVTTPGKRRPQQHTTYISPTPDHRRDDGSLLQELRSTLRGSSSEGQEGRSSTTPMTATTVTRYTTSSSPSGENTTEGSYDDAFRRLTSRLLADPQPRGYRYS